MDIAAQLRRVIAKLQSVVTRGVLTRTNDDAATQTIQAEMRFDEVADMVEHFQPWGVSFRPTADSEVIILSVGSSSDNLVAISATDRSIRPTGIDVGEGGLYTPDGWKVFCAGDGTVCLGSKDSEQWLARADRVESEIKKLRDAIMNAKAGTGSPDSGSALLTSMQGLLTAAPAEPTKSDNTRGD